MKREKQNLRGHGRHPLLSCVAAPALRQFQEECHISVIPSSRATVFAALFRQVSGTVNNINADLSACDFNQQTLVNLVPNGSVLSVSAARYSGPAVKRRRSSGQEVTPPLPLSSSVDGHGADHRPLPGASADGRRQSVSPATLAVYAAVTLRSPSDRKVWVAFRHLARGDESASTGLAPRAFLSHQKGKRLSHCFRLLRRRRAVRLCVEYSPLAFVSSVSARSRRFST